MDREKIKLEFPDEDPDRCISAILRLLPRDAYRYAAGGKVDGWLTLVIVLSAGDDEEHLRSTFKVSDDDQFRQAVHYFMTSGVWPAHEQYLGSFTVWLNKLIMLIT